MQNQLKWVFAMLLVAFTFGLANGQSCSYPYTGNVLQASDSYTLASGNTGVAILFRNSSYAWTPADLTHLEFDVTLNGCSPYINQVILTSFNGQATATVTSSNTAHFEFNNSSNPFLLVDNEVTMILELAACSGSGSVDVEINNISMEFNNSPVSCGACNNEAEIPSCANACNTTDRHLTVLGPYTGYTGNPFIAIIYNTPNTFIDNVTGLYTKVYLSGDMNIINAWPGSLGSGASVSFSAKEASVFYFGAPVQLVTNDPVLILELDGEGCSHLNFCSEFLRVDNMNANLSGCNSGDLCTDGFGDGGREEVKRKNDFPLITPNYVESIQAPTDWVADLQNAPKVYPNPFNESTTIQFTVAEAGNAELTLLNQMGQVVSTQSRAVTEGENIFEVDGSDLANGVYFFQLKTNTQTVTGRMVRQ